VAIAESVATLTYRAACFTKCNQRLTYSWLWRCEFRVCAVRAPARPDSASRDPARPDLAWEATLLMRTSCWIQYSFDGAQIVLPIDDVDLKGITRSYVLLEATRGVSMHSKHKTAVLGTAIYSTCFGYETETGVVRILVKVELSSAISMESSCRDLKNDMAEHRSILKNNLNTHYSLIFRCRPIFSHINGKLSPRPFEWYGWT